MDINQTFTIWKTVLFNPSLQTFELEKSRAQPKVAWWWMAFAGLVGVLIPLLIGLTNSLLFATSDEVWAKFAFALISVLIAGAFIPYSLFLYSLILFVIAKLVGGQGDFDKQTYLLATFWAPLWLIGLTFGIVPIIGWGIVWGLTIYQFVLSYYVIQATHMLTRAKSYPLKPHKVVPGFERGNRRGEQAENEAN